MHAPLTPCHTTAARTGQGERGEGVARGWAKEELAGVAKKRLEQKEGGERGRKRTEGAPLKEKGGWKEGVGELEECHNSLQIGEADVQSLTWPYTVPFRGAMHAQPSCKIMLVAWPLRPRRSSPTDLARPNRDITTCTNTNICRTTLPLGPRSAARMTCRGSQPSSIFHPPFSGYRSVHQPRGAPSVCVSD